MGEFLLEVSGADRPSPWWMWPVAVVVAVGAVVLMRAPRG